MVFFLDMHESGCTVEGGMRVGRGMMEAPE